MVYEDWNTLELELLHDSPFSFLYATLKREQDYNERELWEKVKIWCFPFSRRNLVQLAYKDEISPYW